MSASGLPSGPKIIRPPSWFAAFGMPVRIGSSRPSEPLRYVVRSTRVVDPSEVSVLAPTRKSTLTLVTCYPFNYIGAAPKRFVVRAEIAH